MFLGAAIEQHDNQQTHQRKGNVAVNAPGERRFSAQPLVLRHHAQRNAHGSQSVHRGGQLLLSLDLIALTPDVVEQHIEHGHGDRGNPFAQSQRYGEVFKPCGAQCNRTRNQVERVACAQHNCHQTEQTELLVALASTNHQNADGNDGHQINSVKERFNNRLHSKLLSFFVLFLVGCCGEEWFPEPKAARRAPHRILKCFQFAPLCFCLFPLFYERCSVCA